VEFKNENSWRRVSSEIFRERTGLSGILMIATENPVNARDECVIQSHLLSILPESTTYLWSISRELFNRMRVLIRQFYRHGQGFEILSWHDQGSPFIEYLKARDNELSLIEFQYKRTHID